MAEHQSTRRIVVLGKTGAGKSSIANTIFGGECVFEVDTSANSGTKICQSDIKEVNGRNIQLIDTPGLLHTDLRSTDLSPEILKCMTECAPGPHAFLLVLKVERYTMMEQAVVNLMLNYFSEEALKYTTVVFTRGDELSEGMKIKDWVNENAALRKLVDKCGGRCHVFDNKYWNNSQDQYRNNQVQVKELLETIDITVRKNKGYYTNEMQQKLCETQREADDPNTFFTSQKTSDYTITKINGGSMSRAVVEAFLEVAFAAIPCVGASCVAKCVASGVEKAALVGGVRGRVIGEVVGTCLSILSSPTEAVQDAKAFLKELEELFEQIAKTKEAAKKAFS